MFKWIRTRIKSILLTASLLILILIMVEIVLISGVWDDKRTVEIAMGTHSSSDSPTSKQFFLVEDVTPEDVKIRWKDILILTKDPCSDAYLNESRDPPVLECPKYLKAVKGKDYTIEDKDGNNKVSKGDSVTFDLAKSQSWGKDISFKWKKNDHILYSDRLAGY